MKNLNFLRKIDDDLAFCSNYWVVLHGSYVVDKFIPNRSDIDVAIITQTRDKQSNLKTWRNFLGLAPPLYDLRIFELLPLYFQIEIIKNYRVVFGDSLEISEYFYHFRAIWKDMVKRFEANQFHSIQEKLDKVALRQSLTK